MKLAIMQPYFMPYLGYFQLINAVDTFVIYDDVNYIKRGFINRNNILMNGEKIYFNIDVSKVSQNKLINEHYIIISTEDIEKKLITLKTSYKKAINYENINTLIEKILNNSEKNLAYFLKNSIEDICDYLDIDTKLILSSSLEKNNSLKGQNKILSICQNLNVDSYINALGGQELYCFNEFEKYNINLSFINMDKIVYKQFENKFTPNLSIIDVLMFNSKEEVKKMLNQYTLIKKGDVLNVTK